MGETCNALQRCNIKERQDYADDNKTRLVLQSNRESMYEEHADGPYHTPASSFLGINVVISSDDFGYKRSVGSISALCPRADLDSGLALPAGPSDSAVLIQELRLSLARSAYFQPPPSERVTGYSQIFCA